MIKSTKNTAPYIVVAYASTGSGHFIAAKSIKDALEQTYPDAFVLMVDILDFFFKNIDGNTVMGFTNGAFAPVFDLCWRKNFTGRIAWGGGLLWPSFLYKKFEDFLIEKSPDVVICTHFVCSNAAAKARIRSCGKFKIVSVPTDYETEGLWPHQQTDLFCVATDEMEITLKQRKVPQNKIMKTGIPVDECFSKQIDKIKAKQEFGIPQDKKLVLIVAGSQESGPYAHMRKTLKGCLKYFAKMHWAHFVFCVGKDSAYASKILKKCDNCKADNIEVFTYIEDFAKLFKSADIALIKPGGLALTECACAQVPVLLVGKAFAQENINRRYFTVSNAAEHATSYKGVVNLLCDIFLQEKKYTRMHNNISKIGNRKAAQRIAKLSYNLINEKPSSLDNKKKSIYIVNKPAHTR